MTGVQMQKGDKGDRREPSENHRKRTWGGGGGKRKYMSSAAGSEAGTGVNKAEHPSSGLGRMDKLPEGWFAAPDG